MAGTATSPTHERAFTKHVAGLFANRRENGDRRFVPKQQSVSQLLENAALACKSSFFLACSKQVTSDKMLIKLLEQYSRALYLSLDRIYYQIPPSVATFLPQSVQGQIELIILYRADNSEKPGGFIVRQRLAIGDGSERHTCPR
jgi:hypothetical protein